MEPWHRLRLLACLAVMLGMLGVGGFALIVWGVPKYPYGESPHSAADPFWDAARSPNPFDDLAGYYDVETFNRMPIMER